MARVRLVGPHGEGPREVEIRREGQRVVFILEGETVEATVMEGCLLLGERVVPYAAVAGEDGVEVWMEGGVWRFRQTRDRRSAGAASQTAPVGDVLAPMPGVLVKVLASAGDRVQAGQAVAVLESMKMEIDLVAPRSGRVERVLCNPGDQVEIGTLVAVVSDDSP